MINPDIKLLAVHDNLEKQIKALKLKHGVDGAKGDQGDRGAQGASGAQGAAGAQGASGDQGDQGDQGVSVIEATVALDNHLVFKLSDGNEIDAGEISGGTGGDQYFRSGSKVTINNTTSEDFTNPVFTYTTGVLTLITYGSGITKDFTYTLGALTQIVQTSVSGVITTKTFNYTNGVLTSITEA